MGGHACFNCFYAGGLAPAEQFPAFAKPLFCRKPETLTEKIWPHVWPIVESNFVCLNWRQAPNMAGMIVMWSGSIETIPTGWHLCDGTEGTPDLRDMFIVGAGTTYVPGQTAGRVDHRHTGTTYGNTDGLQVGEEVAAGEVWSSETNGHTHNFLSAYSGHLPPYFALAYIMFL